jgi:Domain of Unknown Function (DUF1206)
MSSVSSQAHGVASRAADSTWLERLTRGGFIGYGVIHLLFAWLAFQIAFGGSSTEGDQSGALQTLAKQPFGTFLIGLIAVGMIAMTIWQGFEAAIGHRGERGGRRVAERVVSAGRAVIYLYVAWTGIKVLQGISTSSADSQQQTSQQLMASGGGRFLVGLAGLVVAGIGVGLVVYGVRKQFEKHLETGRMSPKVRMVSRRLGIAGYAAKGVAYAIAGVLLLVAAVQYDPEKARGLDAALRTLAGQSYGPWLLALVALGIAAFGLFCVVQARYRKV